MSVDREQLIAAFHAAVAQCDPAFRVRGWIEADDVETVVRGRRRFGVAIGKAALAMARGAGPVERGVVVIPARDAGASDFADVPSGWHVIESAHPFVDERSVIAAREARAVVDAAGEGDVVLALISGGASALIEEPIDGITIEEFAATTRAVMESGASIEELNTVRSAMSRVKRGGLVATCAAPVVTLALSDVIGDGLAIIGSGPTIGSWFVDDEDTRRERTRRIIEQSKLVTRARIEAIASAVERAKAGEPLAPFVELPRLSGLAYRGQSPRDRDIALVAGRMAEFGQSAMWSLGHQMWLEYLDAPLVGDVHACAERLVARVGVAVAIGEDEHTEVHGTYVAWGEPTLRVPEDHGEGGRAQQLALELAKALRKTNLIAMAIGSDGVDGPPPAERPAPAGAIVDGSTWDAIIAAGHDPERALARCDAGTVLDAVGALVVTGPTGINHGDLVVIGDHRR